MEVEVVEGEGALLVVIVGHPVVTNGILCVRGGDTALPKLLWDFLLVCISGRIHLFLLCMAYFYICDSADCDRVACTMWYNVLIWTLAPLLFTGLFDD